MKGDQMVYRWADKFRAWTRRLVIRQMARLLAEITDDDNEQRIGYHVSELMRLIEVEAVGAGLVVESVAIEPDPQEGYLYTVNHADDEIAAETNDG